MQLGDITFAQLRALLAVKQTGSITAAASFLRVTQPVLTRGLRLLEQQLGVTLLHRSPRGATLTEYGEALVARAQRVDEELRRAREEISQLQGRFNGKVTIACSPIPMMLFVPDAIGQLQQTFPGVQVHIIEAVYPEVMQEFRRSRIDFAIGPVPEHGLGRDYKAVGLLTADMVAAVRRGTPKSRVRSLKQLQDQGWMVMGPPEGPGAIVDKVFKKHGLKPPNTQLYVDTVWAALEMIKHSQLVGFIPKPLAEWAQDDIAIVPVTEKLPDLRIDIIIASTAILTPAARALVSAVRASASAWQRRHANAGRATKVSSE